jgi:hypothetical protein
MTTKSQALFLGCVGLQLEELTFKLKSRISRHFAPSGIGARSAKLSHLLSMATSNYSADEDGEEQDAEQPMNHDGAFFTCAVTGVASHMLDVSFRSQSWT